MSRHWQIPVIVPGMHAEIQPETPSLLKSNKLPISKSLYRAAQFQFKSVFLQCLLHSKSL
jgi:hypothetical protein